MNSWLPSLKTNTPQEGFELAISLARKAVEYTQPSAEIRKELRPKYANDPNSLIMVSHVVGAYFNTIAAANNYWNCTNYPYEYYTYQHPYMNYML